MMPAHEALTGKDESLAVRPLTRAAWGVRLQFFIAGASFATWGVNVPNVKAHYALGEQALACAMLASGVGALLALTQAGRFVARHGPRAVALVCGLLALLVISALLAFDSYAALIALMLVYGITTSLFDVSVNAEATEIERRAGRPLMTGFHGLFSLGGLAGSALGGALQHAGVGASTHLGAVAVAGAAIVLAGCALMLPLQGGHAAGAAFAWPRKSLVGLGLLAAFGLLAEGAMYDWSVLYLRQGLHSDPGTASLGYAAFSGAMAAARFAGDGVRRRLSALTLLRASGLIAAAGMSLALLAAQPLVVLVGFAFVGLGFANVVPLLFVAAARVPGVSAAQGIAAVSSLAYLGMMAGPPLIGLVAQHRTLAQGLAAVVVFALGLALSARRALVSAGAAP